MYSKYFYSTDFKSNHFLLFVVADHYNHFFGVKCLTLRLTTIPSYCRHLFFVQTSKVSNIEYNHRHYRYHYRRFHCNDQDHYCFHHRQQTGNKTYRRWISYSILYSTMFHLLIVVFIFVCIPWVITSWIVLHFVYILWKMLPNKILKMFVVIPYLSVHKVWFDTWHCS